MTPYYETELGQLFCTKHESFSLDAGLKPNAFSLCLTDPPYGLNIAKDGFVGIGKLAPLTDYGEQDWDSKTPDKEVFDELRRVSKEQIFFGGNFFADKLPVSSCWIIWDKGVPLGFARANAEMAWTSTTSYTRIYRYLWHGMLRVENERRYHCTQKPVALFKRIVSEFSYEDDLIFDPYMGSGTTALACEDLKRRWIGCEQDEKFCEVIKQRIIDYSKQVKFF